MVKYMSVATGLMALAILMAAFFAEAKVNTIDISFITVNGNPTVEIIKNDMIYQVQIKKEDLENLPPSEIVRKVCKESGLCDPNKRTY